MYISIANMQFSRQLHVIAHSFSALDSIKAKSHEKAINETLQICRSLVYIPKCIEANFYRTRSNSVPATKQYIVLLLLVLLINRDLEGKRKIVGNFTMPWQW